MTDQPHYRPFKALKVAILLLMGGLMLLQGFQLYYEFSSLNHILQLRSGVRVPLAEILANDRKRTQAGLDFVALSIPTAIVFLCILFRLRRNVEAWGIRDLPISAGWTVGYFFIPILNLFRPFQAVRHLCRASQPVNNRWQINPVPSVVGVWWFLWIVCGFLNCAIFFSVFVVAAQTFEEALAEMVFTIVVSLMTIALIIVAAWMLIRLMQMQNEKYQRVGEHTGRDLTCPDCGEAISGNTDQECCPVCGASNISDLISGATSETHAKSGSPTSE